LRGDAIAADEETAMRSLSLPFRLVSCLCAAAGLHAGDAWDAVVRGTDARTPADERAAFHLPPGFEIQLVASEPDIQKPINMAFDAKGRLWVSDTREYPFPAKEGEGRDTIKVLDGFAADGHATRISTFADKLNIPIGLYPYQQGVIAYSIPDIWSLQDRDGDGVADQRTRLCGSIGRDDTHGMTNAFRRGFDGWLYACHGFKNKSRLTGTDGSTIALESGNTYRMRPDGSHLEQYTWGQVNPFGLSWDELGNLYSSDCHSKPIYQLLRGGRYPTFGDNDDGMGLAPEMMTHMHGSTALCGICYYSATQFPQAYRGTCFVCNVVTSRINHDAFTTHGSSRVATERPDFVSSDDPWFRPVDLQIAPDGSLYVADFYNKIIGHYEIDLKDPRRDRLRGRIWRIVYTGAGAAPLAPPRDLSTADAGQLVAALGDPNLMVRKLAMDQLTDRLGEAAAPAVAKALASAEPLRRLHAGWVLERLGKLDDAALAAIAKDPDAGVRVQAFAMLAERATWSDAQAALVRAALADGDAFVRRAAADGLGRHPAPANLRLLLDAIAAAPGDDTHLVYKLRQALRDQFRQPGMFAQLAAAHPSEAELRVIARLASTVASAESSAFLLAHLATAGEDAATTGRYVKAIVGNVDEADLPKLAALVRQRYGEDPKTQLDLLAAADGGLRKRGMQRGAALQAWAGEVVTGVLADAAKPLAAWTSRPLEGSASGDPWEVQPRDSADHVKGAPFLSSLPRGEQRTGILRSPPFVIPARLSFFMAGHNGPLDRHDPPRNLVRLRDAASGTVLKEALPPRDDLAQPTVWDLAACAGQQGVIEVVDGDAGDGYAWLAIGRFDPPVAPVKLSAGDGLAKAAAEVAGSFRIAAAQAPLAAVVAGRTFTDETRVAAAKALVKLGAGDPLAVLGAVLDDAAESLDLRGRIAEALAATAAPAALARIAAGMPGAPERLQLAYAKALSSSANGGALLLALVAEAKAPPRLLLDHGINDRLAAADPGNAARLAALTKGVPPLSVERDQLIAQRAAGWRAAHGDAAAGRRVFAATCAPCHRLEGAGAMIGPQLDGAGKRGADRLLEDIIDPSRNVDRAFRLSTITLNDGQVVSGFVRREEGDSLIVADLTGKESPLARSAVKLVTESTTSLMRDDLGQALPAQDLYDLLAYLLAH
jgi:putative heme-binding domain-containing protein